MGALRTESGRFLSSGDESGTAPEDRPFRPDVEGLRAVAVAVVVLFHAGVASLSGGYIGVDVFFVISGFVITGVLLRERVASGRTSILAFYGRRCRRIIPAATLVIIITVALSYVYLGNGAGGLTATDGRWASVFLANFHFTSVGTDYLASQRPPSPLQNYWSLSVEEQFYVVYPTLFLLLAGVRARLSLRVRLAIGLVLVLGGSLAFSVFNTVSNPTSAYFSPLTRAWELALGALIAVATPWLLKVPTRIAATATWLGLGAIMAAVFTFTTQTAYPGSLVTVPVLGAALVIAGGVRAPRFGAEMVLALAPFRWLGRISYSLYLWHWPILIVAAEHANRKSLPVLQSLGLVVVALLASVITYVLVENPIRHARALLRIRWASVGLGVALVAVALGAITLQSDLAGGSTISAGYVATPTSTSASAGGFGASLQTVLSLVAASDQIRRVPADLVPPLPEALAEPLSMFGVPPSNTGCWPGIYDSTVPSCNFGDPHGKHTMVLYGDSHAAMWFRALDDIAIRAHWRLVTLTKGACPAAPIPERAVGVTGTWVACNQWHQYAIDRINRTDPDLLIVSQTVPAIHYTASEWQRGLEQLFNRVTAPKTTKLFLGDIPLTSYISLTSPQSTCLASHVDNVQACSVSPVSLETHYNNADKLAAAATGARYVDVTPWFCAKTCSVVIGKYAVYYIADHVAVGYSRFLEGVLSQALDLPGFGQAVHPH